MKDLIAKFRAFPGAKKAWIVALTAFFATLGGDYVLHVRPAAMSANHHPVNLQVRGADGKVKYGATGDNTEGIFIDTTNHALDFNSKKGAHVANGTVSTDVAAYGQIAATRLDQFASPTASVNLGSQKLISMADGTASSDGAAYHQIGDAILAGRAVACDALTTSNQGTLSGLAQTIDGVALSTAGMRACTFGQTTVAQDGCYVVASGAWTRCTDLPAGTNASNRFFVTVAGSANKGVWAVQVGTNVVGTNDIVVANQATGGGGGQSFPPSNDLAMGSHGFTGLRDPAAAQEAVTLNYYQTQRLSLRNRLHLDDDFVSGSAPGATPAPWSNNSSGTGASATVVTTSQSTAHFGIVQMSTGTTNTGHAGISTQASPITLGSGQSLSFEFEIEVPTLSTTGTEQFVLRCGVIDTASGADFANGLAFEYDAANDTHYVLETAAASTRTRSASTVTVDTGYHRVRETWNGTAAGLEIDGTDTGIAVTTNIPSVILFPACVITKSAGTTPRTALLDWVVIDGTFSTPRNN